MISVLEGEESSDNESVKGLVETVLRESEGTVIKEMITPEFEIKSEAFGEGIITIKQGYQSKGKSSSIW